MKQVKTGFVGGRLPYVYIHIIYMWLFVTIAKYWSLTLCLGMISCDVVLCVSSAMCI